VQAGSLRYEFMTQLARALAEHLCVAAFSEQTEQPLDALACALDHTLAAERPEDIQSHTHAAAGHAHVMHRLVVGFLEQPRQRIPQIRGMGLADQRAEIDHILNKFLWHLHLS